MRFAILAAAAVLTGACTELSEPTLVRYEVASPFYVRHIPWVDSEARADQIAAGVCDEAGGKAKLISAEQYYGFDIRYATYRCVEGESASPAGGPTPTSGNPS
jgi:hypothetical protein